MVKRDTRIGNRVIEKYRYPILWYKHRIVDIKPDSFCSPAEDGVLEEFAQGVETRAKKS